MAYPPAAAPAAPLTSSFPSLPGSRRFPKLPFPSDSTSLIIIRRPRSLPPAAMIAAASSAATAAPIDNNNKKKMKKTDGEKRNKEVVVQVGEEEEEEEEEVEEELPWIQEKALDLVEFTGSVTQAIPGPRVGQTSFPWILALPLTYLGITFVIAMVKTVNKFSSPRHKRRTLVNKNAMLCKSIDELFEKGGEGGGAGLPPSALNALSKKTGFTVEDILRKYIRYALNEKPFNPQLVANLIHLRRASSLDDSRVAEILNEISSRIVKEKGPVVMDLLGYTEKGFKRKLAVQALFGKVFYLSELPEFCSRDSSLVVKEIFGVTDEDSNKLRLHTLSEAGDMDLLEKMVEGSDSEDTNEKSSYAS